MRYQSHLALPDFGLQGQRRLGQARVVILGLGGVGSPASLYLAAAGVGHLTLCDFDRVSESNLNRQVLYTVADVGRLKTEAAASRLAQLNPEVELDTVRSRLTADNLADVIGTADLLLDASDNFATRLAANRACVLTRTPWIMAAALRFEGQLAFLRPDRDKQPCYRCLYQSAPDTPEDCARAGVLSTAAGTMGLAAAGQAQCFLAGLPVPGGLHLYDARSLGWTTLAGQRDPDCEACGC